MSEWITSIAAEGSMSRRAGSGLLFVAVATIWGTPYLLIKLALDDFPPAFVAWARIAVAAVVLGAVVRPRQLGDVVRTSGRSVAGLAVVQFAVPLVLIAEGERHISSGLAGILVASEPLWIALLATRLDRAQRSSWRGLLGVLVGLAGVALLLGVDAGAHAGLRSGVLVVLGAGCYATAALWLPRATAQVAPLPLIAVGLAIAAAALAPLGLSALPLAVPSVSSIAALAALALVCTALAFPLWFALIERAGAARASLITYISPIVAVALGAAALGERLEPTAAPAIALIFAGSVLAARDRRRPGPGRQRQGATCVPHILDPHQEAST